MCEAKLVRNLLILSLFFTQMLLHIKGVRAHSEEDDTPDPRKLIDQRQNGKYNIHVVIKNVAIIEMERNEVVDPSYNDEDYYYDDDDLTIKPLNIKTTTAAAKPLDDCTTNNNTKSSIQTTISPAQSQSNDTTTNASRVTLNSTLSNNISETSHRPAVDIKLRGRAKAIHAIDEQVLQRRQQWKNFKQDSPIQAETRNPAQKEDSNTIPSSRIHKLKVIRSIRIPQNIPQKERCRSHQYRDPRGNCRAKRSSGSGSIL